MIRIVAEAENEIPDMPHCPMCGIKIWSEDDIYRCGCQLGYDYGGSRKWYVKVTIEATADR